MDPRLFLVAKWGLAALSATLSLALVAWLEGVPLF